VGRLGPASWGSLVALVAGRLGSASQFSYPSPSIRKGTDCCGGRGVICSERRRTTWSRWALVALVIGSLGSASQSRMNRACRGRTCVRMSVTRS
jgi:hypothetical protein